MQVEQQISNTYVDVNKRISYLFKIVGIEKFINATVMMQQILASLSNFSYHNPHDFHVNYQFLSTMCKSNQLINCKIPLKKTKVELKAPLTSMLVWWTLWNVLWIVGGWSMVWAQAQAHARASKPE